MAARYRVLQETKHLAVAALWRCGVVAEYFTLEFITFLWCTVVTFLGWTQSHRHEGFLPSRRACYPWLRSKSQIESCTHLWRMYTSGECTPLTNHSNPALLVASQASAPTNFAVWRGAATTKIRQRCTFARAIWMTLPCLPAPLLLK
jgi:hypothetical protein